MLRRDFLKALAVVAASAAVPSFAAPVNPHQKYIDALALFDNVVEYGQQAKAISPSFFGPQWDGLSEKIDVLYGHINQHFMAPDYSQELMDAAAAVLKRSPREDADKLRSMPPQYAEMLWPFIATRLLLAYHKLPANPKASPEFGKHIAAYKHAILGWPQPI